MSKSKQKHPAENGGAQNAEERMNHAVNTPAVDDQNLNHNHNTKKQALGPNTKR